MKVIDAILLVLIIGIGGGYYFFSHRAASCQKGYMQLTHDVKLFIDSEINKAHTQRPALPGLKELTSKLMAAEASLTELQNLRAVYLQSYSDFSKAVKVLADRRRKRENEMSAWTTGLKAYALRSCNKPKKAKK